MGNTVDIGNPLDTLKKYLHMGLHGIERSQVLEIAEDGKVERSLAEDIIKVSAYWYKHPSGVPVNAPKHYKRIYSPYARKDAIVFALSGESHKIINIRKQKDWKIDFGSNTFAISKAITRCQKTLLDYLDSVENINIDQIKELLRLNVHQSVENFDGDEYTTYAVTDKSYMVFGANAICINSFVNYILKQCQTFKKENPKYRVTCPICWQHFNNKQELREHKNSFH